MSRSDAMSTATDMVLDEKPLPASPPASEDAGEGDLPLKVIQRRSGWQFLDLRELWRAREILFFLTWREVKVRYKQTVLGAAWAVLQPLALMAAFSIFLGSVASEEGARIPYPLFVFAGLLPWTFFSAAVSGASTSVVANEKLVTKIYFPRLLVPVSLVVTAALDLAISFALLVVMQLCFQAPPGVSILALPIVLAVLLLLSAGLGILLSALTVAYRDIRIIVPLALQICMYATPALYMQNLNVLGPRTSAWLFLNPLHGVLMNFRAATLGTAFDWPALAVSAACGVAVLLLGCVYFRRVERGFADII
jgi:lipopolysaccharide transport system permease protein